MTETDFHNSGLIKSTFLNVSINACLLRTGEYCISVYEQKPEHSVEKSIILKLTEEEFDHILKAFQQLLEANKATNKI